MPDSSRCYPGFDAADEYCKRKAESLVFSGFVWLTAGLPEHNQACERAQTRSVQTAADTTTVRLMAWG